MEVEARAAGGETNVHVLSDPLIAPKAVGVTVTTEAEGLVLAMLFDSVPQSHRPIAGVVKQLTDKRDHINGKVSAVDVGGRTSEIVEGVGCDDLVNVGLRIPLGVRLRRPRERRHSAAVGGGHWGLLCWTPIQYTHRSDLSSFPGIPVCPASRGTVFR